MVARRLHSVFFSRPEVRDTAKLVVLGGNITTYYRPH